MELINNFVEYQNNFKGVDLERYMMERTEIPVFIVAIYFGLVFYFPQVMERKTPANLKIFFMLWNLTLSVFSIIGAIYTIPVLVEKLTTHGWFYTICQEPSDGFYHDGAVGFWVAAFILSKIPELMDTVFLVVQKKPVIFLHWFHHCTVMLYCWHAYTSRIGAGLWFAAMNYGVHGIMYTYYFMMCFQVGKKLVRPFAVYITSLQIAQMIMGMTVTVYEFIYYDPSNPKTCAVNQSNMRMGLMMYTSYFILFGSLFNKLYLSKSKNQRKNVDGRDDLCAQSTVEASKKMVGAQKQD